ncbi:YbdD/YjiX family protein [Falsarthrobacter nasiphocae]|nr:YbdD/YjiX family protein [Falsarthrobacter nasiphocae]
MGDGQAAAPPRRGVRDVAASVARFARGVMGADAYEKYAAHHARLEARGECPGRLMTEREFWRDKTDRQDREPQGRCC